MSTTHDKRVIIYPSYINKKLKISEGRRLPIEKAVDDPTALEIFDSVTKALNLEAELERDKCYSRDFWVVGRVRVSLKHEDGTPVRPDIPNRKVLMERLAEWVPKHPGRSKKAQALAAQQQQKAQASNSGGGGGGKKKGKKGKR